MRSSASDYFMEFEPDPSAAAEVANTKQRPDGTPWGDRPVRTAHQWGQMAIAYSIELGRVMAALVRDQRAAPGVEVLARTQLESVGFGCIK
jgi:hypothetical protein